MDSKLCGWEKSHVLGINDRQIHERLGQLQEAVVQYRAGGYVGLTI